jgi:hypothetical protein
MIETLWNRFESPTLARTPVNETRPAGEKKERGAKRKRKTRAKPEVPTYREGVGPLGYISQSTRPDCAFSHTELSRHLEETEPPMDLLLRTIGYLMRTKGQRLIFTRQEGKSSFSEMLEAWSDADWSSPRSTSGFMICYGGMAFLWKSLTQKSIALSTCESETVSLCACAKAQKVLDNVIFEIFGEHLHDIPNFVDNQSTVDINKNFYTSMRCRHYSSEFILPIGISILFAPTRRHREFTLTEFPSYRIICAIMGYRSCEQR